MINNTQNQQSENIRQYTVIGSRRFSNYWWASIMLLGATGFLLTGISSYLGSNILPIIHSENIIFFPQGIVMCFYGILGLFFSLYLWLTILWSVGGGFNEFNKKDGIIRIFRWGFPGKNRRIDLLYSLYDVEGIRVELKDGLNPRRTIYLRLKGNREIPLTRIGQPMSLEEIEKQAAELARFLQVSLEGI
jgi:hypothetical protein|uniref:Photosystem I assembly protein Ycf4 n=1 Tax=Binuclearia lauterbornii TaxID=3087189 RepID=A0A097KPF7_9CHLO|nr:hypothetical chloroplast RF4 [Binuclearia lauterbornii]AIT95062.1 hypothetical chloroplast RF4 [Binuclearia lauterbornii]